MDVPIFLVLEMLCKGGSLDATTLVTAKWENNNKRIKPAHTNIIENKLYILSDCDFISFDTAMHQ